MKWFEAVKQWNATNKGKYVNPKKGTKEYEAVSAIFKKSESIPAAPKPTPTIRIKRTPAAQKPPPTIRIKRTPAAPKPPPTIRIKRTPASRAALAAAIAAPMPPPTIRIRRSVPASTHQLTQQLVVERMRANKRDSAATAVEQIGRRIKEDPAYFNQKIDELKDVYTQLFPRPMDPIVLDEWRDDLKIWMWAKVATLNPPKSFEDLPMKDYETILSMLGPMGQYTAVRMNLGGLDRETAANLVAERGPPEFEAASQDPYLLYFLTGDLKYEQGARDVAYIEESIDCRDLYTPYDLPIFPTIEGDYYYFPQTLQAVGGGGYIQFNEDRFADLDKINPYFKDIEFDGIQRTVRRPDADLIETAPAFARTLNRQYQIGKALVDEQIDDGGYGFDDIEESPEQIMQEWRDYIAEWTEQNDANEAERAQMAQGANMEPDEMEDMPDFPAPLDPHLTFNQWLMENYEGLAEGSVALNEQTGEFEFKEIEVAMVAIKKNQLPPKGKDLALLNFIISMVFNENPPRPQRLNPALFPMGISLE